MGFLNLSTNILGGKIFWYTLREENRWKLQQNIFTEHYRVLDHNNKMIEDRLLKFHKLLEFT